MTLTASWFSNNRTLLFINIDYAGIFVLKGLRDERLFFIIRYNVSA